MDGLNASLLDLHNLFGYNTSTLKNFVLLCG